MTPTDDDRKFAREQAEQWVFENSTDMGGGFVPDMHWEAGVATRVLAGILHERERAFSVLRTLAEKYRDLSLKATGDGNHLLANQYATARNDVLDAATALHTPQEPTR